MGQWSASKRVRSPRAPISFVEPCLRTRVDKAPSGDLWAHEIKHDGYRMQIHVRDGRVRLYTMTGVDWTERYPRLVGGAARIKGSAIIDAEACLQEARGVSDFGNLHARGADEEIIAYGFDLLMQNDVDLRAEPWTVRNKALFKLLRRSTGGLHQRAHHGRCWPGHLRPRLQAGAGGHRLKEGRVEVSVRPLQALGEDQEPEGHCSSVSEDKLPAFGLEPKASLVTLSKRLVCKECGSRAVRTYRYVEDNMGAPLVPED